MVHGKEHGYGLLVDKDNNILYEGEFSEGKINEASTISKAATYEENGVKGSDGAMAHGHPKMDVSSGRTMHRQGYFIDAAGHAYDGEWHKNMRHGYGVMHSPSGFIYDGQWRQNVPDGRGIAIYPVSEKRRVLSFVFQM